MKYYVITNSTRHSVAVNPVRSVTVTGGRRKVYFHEPFILIQDIPSGFITTEDEDTIITESGDSLVTE